MTSLKPMLAVQAPEGHAFRYPVLVSPKLDGVRALVRNGVVYSRKLKPIPNQFVQLMFGHDQYEGFDGELIVGNPAAPNVMQATMSGVMSEDGDPPVTFHVFDMWDRPDSTYLQRYQQLEITLAALGADQYNVQLLRQHAVSTDADLAACETAALSAGFEGLMVRCPNAPYKFGRSTAREGYLLKLKRFEDGEAVIVGFEERMHNGNEATVDELGHTKRSHHQANKVGRGDLGAFICKPIFDVRPFEETISFGVRDVEFNIGTGFTDAQRAEYWGQRDQLVGKLVKFKHFAQAGVVDAPRHPVFLGFRDPIDL